MLSNAGMIGYFTLFLLITVVLYPLYKNVFVKKLSKNPNPLYRNAFKILKKIHPVFASAAIITGSYHGFLMLGGFRIHTGSLIIIALLFMGGTFLAGKTKVLRTKWRIYHRAGGLVTVTAVMIHLLFPYLI